MQMRRSLTLPVLALVLGAAAACGGDTSNTGIATAATGAAVSPTPSLSHDDMLLNYVKCMRDHGIDMPDPEPGPKGLTIPEASGPPKGAPGFEANLEKLGVAQQACEGLAPPGWFSDGPQSKEDLENGLKFAKCMRDHGFDYPDPGTGQDNASRNPRDDPRQQQQSSPQYDAAFLECRLESVK